MNIVFDECIPRQLRRSLPDHTVRTVQEIGGAGLKNGDLLAYIAHSGGCEAFITADHNIPFQQSFAHCPFAVVILRARSNRLADLIPLVPDLLQLLPTIRAGVVYPVGAR
jgi:predicted nuclease of predicted toxin-antitoxin system